MASVPPSPIALGAPLAASNEGATPDSPAPQDFERLYAGYYPHVTRWVRAFGCPAADIDDVTQETFLIARRKLPHLDVANIPGWLYRTAQHVTRAQRRRAWLRRALFRDPNEGADLEQTSPIEALEQREARRLMHTILSRLTERRRTVFFLFEIEGYTGEEIAKLEGISVNTVYTRLHHARRDFMSLLAASEARAEEAG